MYSSSDEFVNLEPFIGTTQMLQNPWLPYSGDELVVAPRAHCGGSSDVNACISLTRIAIVLGYYKEWIDERIAISYSQANDEKQGNVEDHTSMYDFINTVFDAENGYSNHQLLNDYHHLIKDHSHQFDDIYNRIIKQCGTSDDNEASEEPTHISYFMKRNYRNKHAFNPQTHNELYFVTNNHSNETKAVKDRCIQQILDTICCYFMYSYRFGYMANQRMKDQIKSQGTDNDDDENDDDGADKPSRKGLVFKSFGRASLSKKARYKKPKQVQQMLNMFTLIKTNRNKLERTLPKDIYDAVYQKKNRFMSVTRFVYKPPHKHVQNDDSEDEKDDEKAIATTTDDDMNEFGYRYYYDDRYKNNNKKDAYNTERNYEYKDWFVVPQYASLKAESLGSKCIKLDIAQWNEIYEKASYYLTSDVAKSMKVESGSKKYFAEITEGALISMDHLIAIQLYTNFAHVEYELSVSCRKVVVTETNDSLKERNSHLANLSRLLSETVQCFGGKPAFSKRFEYFHVIHKAITLPSSIMYNAPLSVSTSKMVAMNALYSYDNEIESQKEGLLLEIGARDTKQFDCKWFSDNTNEYETLLFQCKNAITVQNVIDVELGINYHIYLYAFRMLNAILDGSDLNWNKKQSGMHFEVSDAVHAATVTPIYKFLYHKFYGKEAEYMRRLPIYVEQILNSYFEKLTHIEINWPQMAKLKRNVTGYGAKKNTFNTKIVSFIQPFVCYSQIEWIKWHLMMNAFPNLKRITIHAIKLSKAMFEDLLFHCKKKYAAEKRYCLEKIVLESPVQHKIAYAQAIQEYNQRFAKVQWKITNPSYYELHISKQTQNKDNDFWHE